jgi:type IV pilus assembly protein PilC
MAEYTYTGIDKNGQKVTGTIEAPTEGELRMLLRAKGIRPTRLTKGGGSQMSSGFSALFNPKGGGSSGGSNVKLSLAQISMLTRQLQLLISSGIPMLQGLNILYEQSDDKNLAGVLGVIKDKVSKGSFLWEGLSLYPKTFSNLFVSLVRAGESSGSLDQMLKRLGKYLENSERMRRMVKGAMMYPIIVITVAIGVIVLMMVFVIPKFEDMLKQSGQQLPEITQFVIDASHFMVKNFVFLVGGIGGGVYMLLRWVGTPEGKATMESILFQFPLFGALMQKAGVARFCRTLQTLLAAGVNVIDAVDICRATVDNAVIEKAVGTIRAEIENGKTLGMVLTKLKVFPKMAVQMVMVGESTGNLDKMLEKVADYYEDEVEVMVGGLSKAMEPLILVFLGGAVGGILIAMYLPIFKMSGGVE